MSAKPTYEDLQDRVNKLEKEVAYCRRIQKTVWGERRQLLALLKGFPAYAYLEAPDHTIIYANDFFRARFGDPEGKSCTDFFKKTGGSLSGCPVPDIVREMQPRTWEWPDAPDGNSYRVYAYPFAAGEQNVPLVLELGIDIAGQHPAVRERSILLEELQYAFSEMKAIQNIVPICSCCRRPREDDLHRQQVNDYISSHAGEPFPFDLCPSCRQKYCVASTS